MSKFFFLWLLGNSSLLFSQEVSKKRVVEVLSHLASDEMKGREIGTPENETAALYIAQKFAENKLDYCVGHSYLVPFNYRGKIVYNVCAIKKGKSEKTLAFSAHFDHIGISDNPRDQVFNGADDNASGVTAMIGLADYFKTKEPDFSLMFIAFNGEEKGMKGSKAIVEIPDLQTKHQNIAALFNFEMVATVSQFGPNALYMTGDEFSDVDELFNAQSINNLKIQPDPHIGQQLFYRSDNVSFVKKKIIAHSLSTVDMTKAKHYHQLNDDLEIVDFDNLTEIINNFGKTIEKLNPQNFAPKYTDKVSFE
ncbi:M28 family metallopeptidase [Kaistella antarctica]|uniref:Arginyl aminopeptidase n=1 Tax=Kaistella antarctica TaxID=266748 RepID=A0A3S5EUV0_9FLAO|nr:M28 family peptidase [Kaistella antarctica]KEY17840.1 peptidase M28 [Kaistella antarctica]SEV80379.1 Peptidase family M28 [Kaistella antarctica]VEI00102.1 Arginyl aminopeptidase [Kaistella antarctica]